MPFIPAAVITLTVCHRNQPAVPNSIIPRRRSPLRQDWPPAPHHLHRRRHCSAAVAIAATASPSSQLLLLLQLQLAPPASGFTQFTLYHRNERPATIDLAFPHLSSFLCVSVCLGKAEHLRRSSPSLQATSAGLWQPAV